MKITDYQKVQTLDESNIVLIDGNNGTKTIMVTDFIKSLIGLTSLRIHFRCQSVGTYANQYVVCG